ncbi:MAG: hypothetical protein ABUS57_00325, partial [Pseudomonadota bacterium]
LPATLTLDAGGALNVLLFGLTVLSLAWFAPTLASEVVQGQPHLSGSDAWRSAVGGAFTTIGAGFIAYQGVRNTVAFVGGVGKAIAGARRGSGGAGSGSGAGGAGAAGNTANPRAISYARMNPKPAIPPPPPRPAMPPPQT